MQRLQASGEYRTSQNYETIAVVASVMPAALLMAFLAMQGPTPNRLAPEDLGRVYYLYLQGRQLEGANDLPGALDSLRQAAALLPGNAEIHAALAELYVGQGQLADARREAVAALSSDPDNRLAHRLLGGLQADTIERTPDASGAVVTEAIGHLERALADGANDPNAELALSSLYLRNNEPQKSITTVNDFLAEHPDYAPALRLLIRAYQATGQTSEATKTRLLLARARPDAIELGVAQLNQVERAGRWEDAARGWRDVVSSDPGGAIYRTRLAGALANSGDLEGARQALQLATREAPRDIGTWYFLSIVEGRAGNLAAAEDAANRITQIEPGDARGPLALAGARSAREDYRGAVQALSSRVAAPTPDDLASGIYTQMVGELSEAYTKMGQRKRAIDVLDGARKRQPENQALMFSLAANYEQDRQFELAERTFRDLIAANGKHAGALNYLGYMLVERGQKFPEAVTLIQRALAIEKDNPSYLDSLGWAYFKMGQYDDARQPLEKAATAMPKSSVIQEHLGDLYLQLQRYDDAAAAFGRALAGDRDGIDASAITKKHDRARGLAAGKP